MHSKRISTFVAIVPLILVAAGLVLFTAGCGEGAASGSQAQTLKLAHSLPTDHPVHIAMERMAELAAEKSGGQLELQIIPGEVMGSESAVVEQLQGGMMDMTKVSSAVLESFVPQLSVLGQPYIFRSSDHLFAVLNGEVGDELEASIAEQRLVALCWYDAGARSFYTRKTPIRTPEDLEKRKIRVQSSPTAKQMVEVLGGQPVAVDWGELYSTLQTGGVDGAENNPPSLFKSRQFEVSEYYSLDEHTRVPDVLLIGKTTWDQLSSEQQQWLREAARESSDYQRELWAEASEEAIAAMESEGLEIIRPEKAPFEQAVQPMLDENEGTEMGELIQRIKEVQ
ncbi:MAG: TRAP transporter substrate-binding protein [Phycisphaeraceae bacterium]